MKSKGFGDVDSCFHADHCHGASVLLGHVRIRDDGGVVRVGVLAL